MTRPRWFVLSVVCNVLVACDSPPAPQGDAKPDPGAAAAPTVEIKMVDGVMKKTIPGFGGVIAKSYQDSREWWPAYQESSDALGEWSTELFNDPNADVDAAINSLSGVLQPIYDRAG